MCPGLPSTQIGWHQSSGCGRTWEKTTLSAPWQIPEPRRQGKQDPRHKIDVKTKQMSHATRKLLDWIYQKERNWRRLLWSIRSFHKWKVTQLNCRTQASDQSVKDSSCIKNTLVWKVCRTNLRYSKLWIGFNNFWASDYSNNRRSFSYSMIGIPQEPNKVNTGVSGKH